jgi:hypothetical protein
VKLAHTVDVEVCRACRSPEFVTTGIAPGFVCHLEERNFAQPDYEVRECSACSLFYRTPNLSSLELARYYSLADCRKWEIRSLFPKEKVVLERLPKLRNASRILDYGCSSGPLLAPLVRPVHTSSANQVLAVFRKR